MRRRSNSVSAADSGSAYNWERLIGVRSSLPPHAIGT
jgi:hypothetical protein